MPPKFPGRTLKNSPQDCISDSHTLTVAKILLTTYVFSTLRYFLCSLVTKLFLIIENKQQNQNILKGEDGSWWQEDKKGEKCNQVAAKYTTKNLEAATCPVISL